VGLIETIPPLTVGCSETFDDDIDVELLAEERAVVAHAVAARQHEFATVRRCARDALGKIGVPPVAILPGDRGAPAWPRGVTGSMTHCSGYRAAAVARLDQITSIGIDGEPNRPLPAGVLEVVASGGDRRSLQTLPQGAVAWDRLLFSAKESIFKALDIPTLDFDQVEIAIQGSGTFVARVFVGDNDPEISGRWTAGDGVLVTAVVLPRSLATSPQLADTL